MVDHSGSGSVQRCLHTAQDIAAKGPARGIAVAPLPTAFEAALVAPQSPSSSSGCARCSSCASLGPCPPPHRPDYGLVHSSSSAQRPPHRLSLSRTAVCGAEVCRLRAWPVEALHSAGALLSGPPLRHCASVPARHCTASGIATRSAVRDSAELTTGRSAGLRGRLSVVATSTAQVPHARPTLCLVTSTHPPRSLSQLSPLLRPDHTASSRLRSERQQGSTWSRRSR